MFDRFLPSRKMAWLAAYDVPSLLPDPCLAFSAANWTTAYKTALIGIPIQSYDASPSGCTALVTAKKASTDVVVVRHAANCLPDGTNCEALDNNKVYFQPSFCENETAATPPLRYVVGNTAADFTLKKRNCTGIPPAATVGTLADKRELISNIYYVRTYASTVGDGIPTLMRSTFKLVGTTPAHEEATPLIEGIEGFLVEMGIDAKNRCGTSVDYTTAIGSSTRVDPATCTVSATAASNTMPTNRGDGVPESPFVRCTTASPCTNVQLRDVVAVKLYVLARSRETAPGYTDSKVYCLGSTCVAPTATTCPATSGVAANALPLLGPFCDGFKRHVFQSTIRLNNISGRRETP